MEARIVVWLLLFGFVAGFAGLVVNMSDGSLLRQELAEWQSKVQNLESVAEAKKQAIALRQQSAAASLEQLKKLEALDEGVEKAIFSRDSAEEKITALAGRQSQAENVLAEAVQKSRKQAAGQPLGDFPLPSGKTLLQAKIQRVTDTEIVLYHSLGVFKLSAKDAPAKLVGKFNLKTQEQIEEEKKRLLAAAPAPLEAAIHQPAAAPPQAGDQSPLDDKNVNRPPSGASRLAKIKDLEDRISALQAQIKQALQNKAAWDKRAQEYRELHLRAQMLGRISSHMMKVNDATSKSSQIQSQINAANVMVEDLKRQSASLSTQQE